jgi:hypothetical protein
MEVERTRRVLELEKVALEEEARTVEEQARQVGCSHLVWRRADTTEAVVVQSPWA